MRRRAKARCGVITPPRHPRCRRACSQSGRVTSCFPEGLLKVHEEAKSAPETVIGEIIFALKRHIEAPAWPQPLPPIRGIIMDGKVEERGLRPNQLITFPANFRPHGDVVFFI